MALRRWRLTGVAVIVFVLAAVSVVALQRAVPLKGDAAAAKKPPAKVAAAPVDPDAPAGGEKVIDLMEALRASLEQKSERKPAKRAEVTELSSRRKKKS